MLRRLFSALSPDQWWITLAVFLAGFAEGLWLNLQSLYIEFLGARPDEIGAALGLAGVLVIFVYLPSGFLADRGRRKVLILWAWALTVVALLLQTFAFDWRWAVPGLALYLMASFARPALSAQIAASDRSGNVSRAFAITSISYSIGAMLSPAVGGWVAEQFNLRAVFFTSAVFYFLSLLCVLPLSNPPPEARTRPVRLGRLLSDRWFMWQIVVVMVITFSLNVGVTLAPNYLQDVKGLSLQQIGQLGTVAAIGGMVLTVALGQMSSQRRRSLLIAQLMVAAALIMLIGSPAITAGALPFTLSAAYFLRGGVDATWAPIAGRLSAWLPPEVLSLGFAFRDTAVRIALTLAPVLAGQLYTADPAYPLYAGAASLIVTMLLTLTLPRRRPHAPSVAEAPLPSN